MSKLEEIADNYVDRHMTVILAEGEIMKGGPLWSDRKL